MEAKATLKLKKPDKDNIMGLHFENYDLIYCEYSFFKHINRDGEVISALMGGNIQVALPILPTNELIAWIFGYKKYINGEVIINDTNKEVIDKIYFEEARCVNFRFHYEPNNSLNTVIHMTINCQKMIMGEAIYENSWK